MKHLLLNLTCLALIATSGCDTRDTSTSAKLLTPGDLVGKWRLIRAGGESPSVLNIKSLEINLLKDGTWTSAIEMQGQFAGMSMNGGGKWSLLDNVITYTSGDNSGVSTAQLNGSTLVLDPDFSVRRGGKDEVTGEYER